MCSKLHYFVEEVDEAQGILASVRISFVGLIKVQFNSSASCHIIEYKLIFEKVAVAYGKVNDSSMLLSSVSHQ